MASKVFFGGRLLTTPTSASVINDDAMRPQSPATGNVVAFLGRSTGGLPKQAMRFGSPKEAEDMLVSGELLTAILAAFDPSAETAGPSVVVAIRVNPALQATGTIQGAGSVDQLTLTSVNYGLRENNLKYKVEAGSVAGRRYTVQRGTDYWTADNVARAAFQVQYSGGQASAVMTISNSQVVLSAPTGTAVATIDLTTFATVQDLVDNINTVTGFAAAVLDGNDTAPTLNGLDSVTNVDVKTAAYVARADLQAAVDWFNGNAQGQVRATRAAGAGLIPAVATFKYLTGGTDGSTIMDDWAEAFEELQRNDVQWLTPVSGDPAIHAMADAHAAFMSGIVGKKERRAICGMPAASSDSAAMAAAKALNSDRTSLVHIGEYNYDLSGKLVLYPPYIVAARIAGAFSGINPGTPMTNKTLKIRGVERVLRNPTDTDVLIDAGVLCIEDTEDGYKVVRSISTWLINDNFNRVEVSCGAALDYTVRSVRTACDTLRGKKGSPLLLKSAISLAEGALRECARPEPQGVQAIIAWKNVTAVLEGDVVRIQYEASPAIGVNFVLNTVFATPFSGTATSAAA
jgi:hypothetical protein